VIVIAPEALADLSDSNSVMLLLPLCVCRVEPDKLMEVLDQVPVKLSVVNKVEGCWEVSAALLA
jgi:hypothetical protein